MRIEVGSVGSGRKLNPLLDACDPDVTSCDLASNLEVTAQLALPPLTFRHMRPCSVLHIRDDTCFPSYCFEPSCH
jgi:hypothetical protein